MTDRQPNAPAPKSQPSQEAQALVSSPAPKRRVQTAVISTLVKCNLETPTSETGPRTEPVRFRGWILTVPGAKEGQAKLYSGTRLLHTAQADILRPDVARALLSPDERESLQAHCGFDFTVPDLPEDWKLVMAGPEPQSSTPLPSPSGKADPTEPYALTGANQHLFLAGDSNRSVDQFTGQLKVTDASLQAWHNTLAQMPVWEQEFGLRSAFVIAPAKEEILGDLHPFQQAKPSNYDRVVAHCNGPRLVPLKWPLKARRNFAYCETDTHWTDFGATTAAAELLRTWAMPPEAQAALPTNFRVVQRIGDLGNKITPPQANYELTFGDDLHAQVVFDNTINNNGNITIYQRQDAPVVGTCLVFGDSFGTNFAQALANVFSQLIYTYRPAAFDDTLVRVLRPDYVVLEITQRFMIGHPDLSQSIFDTIREKLVGMTAVERDATLQAHRRYLDTEFAPLVTPILSQSG